MLEQNRAVLLHGVVRTALQVRWQFSRDLQEVRKRATLEGDKKCRAIPDRGDRKCKEPAKARVAGVGQASAEVWATRSERLDRPDHGGDGSSYRVVNGPQSGSRQTREEPLDDGLDESANIGGGEKWSYIRF